MLARVWQRSTCQYAQCHIQFEILGGFSQLARVGRRQNDVKCSKIWGLTFVGEWLSLVEHLVRDQGVGGSNPLSPTILT
jgi:hypothetical protein